MKHELKTWPKYFQAIKDGMKTFEVRKNDRDYQVGDVLILLEYDPDEEAYTGNRIERLVTYILKDASGFGIASDVCVMALMPLTPAA